MRREGGNYGGLCYYAIRDEDYKLVQNTPFEPMQLFNIKEDPLEQQPLDQNPKKFRELQNKLSQHIRASGKIPWQQP
jgi:arylsulfatase A-like enzyme